MITRLEKMDDESIEDDSVEDKSIKDERLVAESIVNESVVSLMNPDEGSNEIYESDYEYEYDDKSITDDRSSDDIKGGIEYTNNCDRNCIETHNYVSNLITK
jgi:hypothetical protein